MYAAQEIPQINAEIAQKVHFRMDTSYDMYGRGYSDRPHDRELYRNQLLELMDAMNLRESLDLVGYSFGGGIVADFTAR